MNRNPRGFTMIELMIVIAVLSILVLIAYPAYDSFVTRTRRSEAKRELLALATAQERYFTNCNAYAAALDGSQANCTGLGGGTATRITENGHYEISLAGGGTAYALTATPRGVQANDSTCGNFTLTDTGAKSVSGSGTVDSCWPR